MTNWNPGATAIMGLEWPATRLRWVQLSRITAAGVIVETQDAQALDAVWAYLRCDVAPAVSGAVQAIIYDADDPFGPPLMQTSATSIAGMAVGETRWVRIPRTGAAFSTTVGQRLLI